jgi:hypothetical protein
MELHHPKELPRMEILVTIVAFWLIMVGAYGAYTLTREGGREGPAKLKVPKPAKIRKGAQSPFGPVTLPAETLPSFLGRVAAQQPAADKTPSISEHGEVRPAKPRPAQRDLRVDAQSATATVNYDYQPRDEELLPVRPDARPDALPAAPRPSTTRHAARTQTLTLAAPSEVDFLRAEVEHLRSEIFALSTERQARDSRPQQRRYRTGSYAVLPRPLKRQVNELRGVRRFRSN